MKEHAAMEKITSDIETIEAEAEKITNSAKSRADEILLKAKEEASQILSRDLPMEEIKTECQEIVRRAKEEAERKTEDSTKKASLIRTNADSKIVIIAERMASIITGAKPG
ncbi:hypothetical protein ACFLUN_00525 [Chloroflexota bacterium]